MKNIDKLKEAKKQYDEMELLRKKASYIFSNEKYLVCVHLHYDNVIVISCAMQGTITAIYASFEMTINDGHITVNEKRNYGEKEIEDMIMFLENILAQ
jgi:hypothetical protein